MHTCVGMVTEQRPSAGCCLELRCVDIRGLPAPQRQWGSLGSWFIEVIFGIGRCEDLRRPHRGLYADACGQPLGYATLPVQPKFFGERYLPQVLRIEACWHAQSHEGGGFPGETPPGVYGKRSGARVSAYCHGGFPRLDDGAGAHARGTFGRYA